MNITSGLNRGKIKDFHIKVFSEWIDFKLFSSKSRTIEEEFRTRFHVNVHRSNILNMIRPEGEYFKSGIIF